MTSATSERRRLALSSDAALFDVAVPVEATARDALASIGIDFDPARHALVTRSGREVDADAPVVALTDGTLLTLVDLAASSPRPTATRDAIERGRTEHHTLWWLLATASVMIAASALGDLARSTTLLGHSTRMPAAAALGLGAALAAALWSLRAPRVGGTGLALTATSGLAFAAGVVAVPHVAGATHLAITVGLLSATVLMALIAVSAQAREVRGAISAAMVVFLILALVWGGTLLLQWETVTAAAISLGIVAPGIRWIPTLLLDFEDGYTINYVNFMSSRWSVRGAVPEDPGPITMDVVGPEVNESIAKLTTGVVMLSALAAVTTPFVAPGLTSRNLLVHIGTIGVLVTTIGALFLSPRRSSSLALRWVPRMAAGAMAMTAVITLALDSTDATRSVLAVALMAAALLAALLIVPVGRGTSSLAWSRLGDVLESLAVALALPMGLLAGDVVESLRTVMAG